VTGGVTYAPRVRVTSAIQAQWQAGGAISLLMLSAAFGLKLIYSHAGASELEWVLAPSCWFASRLCGIELVREAGAGWISHSPRMVVGPACAGVNFLVVSWLALFFSQQGRCIGTRRKLVCLCLSVVAAYLATLATNGLRIVLAAHLYDADFYSGWLTRERLHRLLGVVLYCSALLGLCHAADLYTSRAPLQASRARLTPFLWYLGVAIGVPLANRAFVRAPGHFAEHAALTLGAGGAVVLMFWLIGRLADGLCSQPAGRKRAELRRWQNPES
jgi:exosortase K